jgi:small subunit ribosomal protein S20
MAHAHSAKKRIKQDRIRRMRNKGYKMHMKKKITATLSAAPDGKATALSEAYSAIDRAVKKGVIHKNTASRRKSRLAKKTAV